MPGGYGDALQMLRARDYPTWNVSVAMSYPIGGNQADAQESRAKIQRQQAQGIAYVRRHILMPQAGNPGGDLACRAHRGVLYSTSP